MLIAMLLALQAQAADNAPQPDDIVVTATRDRKDCSVRFADHDMTDREFNERAKDWAGGMPVRVIARTDADIKCLARIAFKLADRGVRRIQFVDPSGARSGPPPPDPTPPASLLSQSPREQSENSESATPPG